MFKRYENTQLLRNNSNIYKQMFNQKKIKNLLQYSTFDFGELKNLENYNLEIITHEVQPQDRLYTISQKYYGSPEYSWLICYTNKKSNELLINTGDLLLIYVPLETLLGLL